jgi:sugar/nucleoside kinase (ribokinase family)
LIYTLITPDRERTFAAWYHGVRYDITDAARALRGEREVIVDGYLLFQPGVAEGLRAWLSERPAGQKIIFCPGDVSVLTEMGADARFVLDHCDHLIMNRNEAATLYPGASGEAVAAELRARGISGAITAGEEGALLFDAEETLRIGPGSLGEPVVNTNGAGDAFTAGYVHGLDRGLTLAETAQLATSCAAEILMTHGARPEHVEDEMLA